MSHNDAVTQCEILGAQILTVENDGELKFVRSIRSDLRQWKQPRKHKTFSQCWANVEDFETNVLWLLGKIEL